MIDANNKAVNYLFRALCQPEFNRVHTEHLACGIWSVLKEAHVGNAQVQARMYATLRTICGSRTGGWSLPCVMSD
jgi:hypothetical protein